jgi:integrase
LGWTPSLLTWVLTQMPFLSDDLVRQLPLPPKHNRVTCDQPDPAIPATADLVVTGMGIKITAAGRRTWGLAYRLRDGSALQRWYTIGRFPYLNTAAARKRARKLREEIEGGADPQGQKSAKRKEPTVAQLADDWQAACARKIKTDTLRQGTVDGYERALRLHIRPQLGSMKIGAITRKTVQRLHEAVTLDDKPVQANRTVATLSTMLAWAVSQELLATNPCIKAVKFNREEPRIRRFDKAESSRFVVELMKHVGDHQSAKALLLLLLTGARKSEVTGMRWADLKGLGSDRPEWHRKGTRLKAKRDHVVALNDEAHQLLLAIREEMLTKNQLSPFVFPSDNTRSGHITDLRKIFSLILRRAGITDFRPHDLRHNFASVVAASGASLSLIGEMLGHRSAASTLRYIHWLGDTKREVSQQAANSILGDTGTNVVPLPLKRGA